MKYKKTGTVQITDDLELKDFTWWVNWAGDVTITVNVTNNIMKIEVMMQMADSLIIHNRMMPIAIPDVVSEANCTNALLATTPFADSTEI